jgi:hypothetical protein
MDFDTLLEQLQKQRPDLVESIALIKKIQDERKQKEEAENIVELDREEKLTALLEKQKSINKGLLHQFRKLEQNYRHMVDQMDQFAEAVGACPHCWGEVMDCSYCHGRGKPGYFRPNPEYFNTYIKPLLSKLKYSQS